MAIKKYICPPTPAAGSGSFSDDLVGFQLVQGGGLTQGNFNFVTTANEKSNRNFITGTFSEPINLSTLGLSSISESKQLFENNYKVYPNFDLSQITNFTIYGSLSKRISVSVQKIISYFPAGIESTFVGINYTTGATASNIIYNKLSNTTTFDVNVARLRNQFDVDFTNESTRNLELREIKVSQLRNLSVEYSKYVLNYENQFFTVAFVEPTESLTTGTLTVSVFGNPFSGQSEVFNSLIIRPNDLEVSKIFNETFDEVEKFLLNRYSNPIYTANFNVPVENEDGTYSSNKQKITWPLNGNWNIDILTASFTRYLEQLDGVANSIDGYKTNLISRFLTTGAFKEFDTIGQKVEKTLQIYGRSFDETKKFIDALAYMNSVNYNTGNDIPSQLLKNLAQTLGWNTNISPITKEDFLSSVFGQQNSEPSNFTGVKTSLTPDELNYQYFKNLILNSAYLFKSKGTRKSVETLMRLIGAPDALVEFNEYVYLADRPINLRQFNTQYAQISGGSYVEQSVVLDPNDVYMFDGVEYTGFTTQMIVKDVMMTRGEFPMDDFGYPMAPEDSESYYFQIGSGWFEQTPAHRAPEEVNLTSSTFVGNNPNYQTSLIPYTYGQVYLERFRKFPFMNLGYNLLKVVDNNKSWVSTEVGFRTNLDGGYNSKYVVDDDKLVLNVKNIDLHLNPAQGLVYDVWHMSREYNYPIPNEGLFYIQPTNCNPTPYESNIMKMSTTQFQASFPNVKYPVRGGVDWTEIDPKPKRQTFFEFAQSFWKNMINVRNRQYMSNGKSMGYPTLESIYWKYLLSEEAIGRPNDNFTYDTMIQYVNGLGDYWVRLVEQMIPASTIWNTGVKYENSVFHRQKHAWRRQRGCQIIPIPCTPCSETSTFLPVDCPIQSAQCPIYLSAGTDPTVTTFSAVLGKVVTNYMTSIGKTPTDCGLNSLRTEWFVDLRINDSILVKNTFFNGLGYNVESFSSPNNTQWYNAIVIALDDLVEKGYDYYLDANGTVTVYNSICSETSQGMTFKINVGINLNLCCN
jgi:hypothetical protein